MSLTSHLADPDSHVRAWFERTLPNTAAVRPWRTSALTCAPISTPDSVHLVWAPRSWPTIVPADPGIHASTLGTALDYRLRLLLAPRAQGLTTVAELGARDLADWFRHRIDGDDAGCREIHEGSAPHVALGVTRGYLQLDREVRTVAADMSRGHRIPGTMERRVGALCWLLALYEQVYRAGIHPSWPLPAAGADADLDALLALVPAGASDHLGELTRLFVRTQPHLLGASRVDVGPVFAQSGALGGADADLLVDGLLVDVKATVDPHLDRDRLWQLAGYALADTPDRLRIRRVGIYFARHGQLLTWPLRDYLCALAGKRVTVRGLRAEFAAAIADER